MNILLVSYEYPPLGGGGGVFVRDLVVELEKRAKVTLLTSWANGLEREECHGNLRIVRVPVMMRDARATASLPSMLSFFPSSLVSGRKLLRQESFDIVHSVFAVPTGPSGLLLARYAKLPHVLSVLGGDLYDPSKKLSPHRTPGLRHAVKWVIHGSDSVVAESNDVAGWARTHYGAPEVELVPLSVSRPEFSPIDRDSLPFSLDSDSVILIAVGRLIPRKNLSTLLDVFATLDAARARLVLVGEGPELPDLQQQAQRLGIASRVHFAGFVSDIEKFQLLSAADVYVSTALHEGFGIVFLEAMACGLPVVAFDSGGQRDFLDDEFSCLPKLGDGDAMSEDLHRLISDPARRTEMGNTASLRAGDFSPQRLAERFVEIYERVLTQRDKGEPTV